MKNSIGSLAALAVFAAPAAMEAAPEAASFSNVALPYETPGSVNFDLDGDSVDDFYVFSNSVFVSLQAHGDTLFTENSQSFGNLVSTSDPTAMSVFLEEVGVPSVGSSYYGLSFTRGGQTHTGWILLNFSGDPKLAVSGGWETNAGQSISVGAVPEPATFAAVAGAGALALACGRRRRKSVLSSSP